jgi:GTP-binding protein EngB required for normal cell division
MINQIDLHKLYELEIKNDVKGISDYLRSTNNTNNGNTILHNACLSNDLELIRLILSYDPLNSFEDLSNYSENVKLLFNIHNNLLKETEKYGISIHRILYLLSEANQKIKSSEKVNKPSILFFGCSGVGKSTFLNFMNGCLYEPFEEDDGTILRKLVKGNEIAKVGNSLFSETLFPEIYNNTNKNLILIDLPGINDNRDKINEASTNQYDIVSSLSLFILSKKIRTIKGLFVMCTEDHLSDARALYIQDTFRQVGRMINKNSSLQKNIVLVITKYSKLKINHVVAKLQKLAVTFSDPDMLSFLNIFISPHNTNINEQIIFADVTDDKFRESIYDYIDKKLENKPTDLFDFEHYSNHAKKLKDLINTIQNIREGLTKKVNFLKSKIQNFYSDNEKNSRDSIITNNTYISEKITIPSSTLQLKLLAIAQEKIMKKLDNIFSVDGLCHNIQIINEKYKSIQQVDEELKALTKHKNMEDFYYRNFDETFVII